MNIITDTVNEIRKMRFRKLLLQGLNFGMIVCSALMIWKTLMIVTNTESPVVVVLRYSSFLKLIHGVVVAWSLPIIVVTSFSWSAGSMWCQETSLCIRSRMRPSR